MLARLRTIVVLVALSLAASLAGVFAVPPLDRDEARFAQATTQMLETGDYVRINFQDQARNKKPVGIYWLQAASVKLFSNAQAREIWAYRLPSALGAALAVAATYLAGCLLLGRTAGMAGGAFLAVSVLLGVEGGIAKTDAMLAGCAAITMLGLAMVYRGRRRPGALVFWLGLAAGVLIKGPIVPMVAGLAIVTLVILDRRAAWARALFWWPGLALAVLVVAPWLTAVQIATDGAFLADAFGSDLGPKLISGHESHGGFPGYHAALLAFLIWPGTLFLVPGAALAAHAFTKPRDNEIAAGARFLVAWALPAWIVFELIPTKLFHYPLPTYPALALLAGFAFAALVERKVPPVSKLLSILLFAVAGGVLVLLLLYLEAAFGPWADDIGVFENGLPVIGLNADALKDQWRPLAPFLAVPFALLILPLALWRAPRVLLVAICALGLSWHWAARQVIAPTLEPLWVSRALAAELDALSLHPAHSPNAKTPLVAVGFHEPSLVFMTNTDTVLAGTPEKAAAIVGAEPGRAALVEGSKAEAFEAALAASGAEAVLVRIVQGYNYSKGDPVEIGVYRTTRAARNPDALAGAVNAPGGGN